MIRHYTFESINESNVDNDGYTLDVAVKAVMDKGLGKPDHAKLLKSKDGSTIKRQERSPWQFFVMLKHLLILKVNLEFLKCPSLTGFISTLPMLEEDIFVNLLIMAI